MGRHEISNFLNNDRNCYFISFEHPQLLVGKAHSTRGARL